MNISWAFCRRDIVKSKALIIPVPSVHPWELSEDWIAQINRNIVAASMTQEARNFQAACLIGRQWDKSWGIALCHRSPSDRTGFDCLNPRYGTLTFGVPDQPASRIPDAVVLVEYPDLLGLLTQFEKTSVNVQLI